MNSPIKLPPLPPIPREVIIDESADGGAIYGQDEDALRTWATAYAEQAVREALAAQEPLFIYDPVADGVTPVWKWPEEPTPSMIKAMRTGSRKDWPSDELCRVRYAALRSAALASAPPKENNHE